MAEGGNKDEECTTPSSGASTTMQVFQLVFTILSFVATIANLPLIVLAYKQLIKRKSQ